MDNVAGVSAERIAKQDWTGRAEARHRPPWRACKRLPRRGREEEGTGGDVATVAALPDTTSSTEAPDDLQLELDDATFEEVPAAGSNVRG